MTLDARTRSSIYQKLVPTLGEDDANALMSEFPSVEADELVTKQFLRAELAELRSEIRGEFAELRAEVRGELAEVRSETTELRSELRGETTELRSELRGETTELRTGITGLGADLRAEMHRQTLWLGSALAGATALLAAVGFFA